MANRSNFSFRYEWSEKIAHLGEKVQYEILVGTVAYAKEGSFPSGASAEALAAFEEYILPDFIKRAKAAEYRARAKARKVAAATEPQAQPEKTTAPAQEPEPAPVPVMLSRAARRRLERERKKRELISRRGAVSSRRPGSCRG